MLLYPVIMGAKGNPGQLTTLEATRLINQKDAILIDVRDQGDYAKRHIANAKNFPEKVLAERKNELDKLKGAPLIVVCSTGLQAPKAAEALRKLGFGDVFTLQGGQSAWSAAGLPMAK